MTDKTDQDPIRSYADDGVDEGDVCGWEGCEGILELEEVEKCSCHINPPCPACEDQGLVCNLCSREVR